METLTIRSNNKFRTLVTMQAYKKGEVICSIPRYNVTSEPNCYTVQIGRESHTYVAKLAALNHSCDPNVVVDTEQMLMIPRRDIAKGEELSYFYPSTEVEMHAPFICLCGAVGCIQVVAGARFLPLSMLENHYLNPHICDMIIERLKNTKLHLRKRQEAYHFPTPSLLRCSHPRRR